MYFFFEHPGFWVKVELFWVVNRFKTSREHAIPWLYEGGEHIVFSVLDIPLRWWGDRDAFISASSHTHNTQKGKRKDRMAAKLCLTIHTKMRASSHRAEQLCTDAKKNHRPRCHSLVLSKWHIMFNEKSTLEVLIYFRFPGWQSWWIDFTHCIARSLWQILKKYKFECFLVSQAHELSEKEQTETARRTANPVIFVFLITNLPW